MHLKAPPIDCVYRKKFSYVLYCISTLGSICPFICHFPSVLPCPAYSYMYLQYAYIFASQHGCLYLSFYPLNIFHHHNLKSQFIEGASSFVRNLFSLLKLVDKNDFWFVPLLSFIRDASGTYLSTGWFTISFMRKLCKTIDIYGMVTEDFCK